MVSRGMGVETTSVRRNCEAFISCRVGMEIQDFQENLDEILEDFQKKTHGDFIVVPIASPRSIFYDDDDEINLLPDLVLPANAWESLIAVSIAHPPMESLDPKAAAKFDRLFRHALYLPVSVVIIDCPETNFSRLSVASKVNRRFKEVHNRPIVLFRVTMKKSVAYSENAIHPHSGQSVASESSSNQVKSCPLSQESQVNEEASSNGESGAENVSTSSNYCDSFSTKAWRSWNTMRNYLDPDLRVGVCLEICEDMDVDYEEQLRWAGEPVRMVILNSDQFVSTPACKGSTRLQGRCREFLRTVLVPTSFKTSFVIRARPGQDVSEHLSYLANLCNSFELQHPDDLRGWNDAVLHPLQPLSMNLDSNTYRIFEMDKIKYLKYQQAMIEALDYLIFLKRKENRQFTVMVLGAGRGPLVDAMIEAINRVGQGQRFKIYALDKNPSSVEALKYKFRRQWSKASKGIQLEVIKGDMRAWQPLEKADIIATELLGSFSDNELSPECIDGTYRFSTSDTISIPQEYRSHLAPICSYKMFQEMNHIHRFDANAFDQIYVVRLSNYYMISEPQELFVFEHKDLSKPPIEGANQRYKKLTFWSKLDTVCHGFAGFFSATLFGSTTISTVPKDKTVSMESWFPAFIPLDEPIRLSPGSKLEVFFWRKDSASKVWYEWRVISPKVTRMYSADGVNTAMSKATD